MLELVIKMVRENLKSDENLILSKKMIQKIGLLNTILLSIYINEDTQQNWFICTHEHITKILPLKEYTVKKTKQELTRFGIIKTKMIGTPAKEHIQVCYENITKLM